MSGPSPDGAGVGEALVALARRYLADEYPRKIDRALAAMTPEDVWWRPNDASNSVGNLVLHLAGNVRQWVVHGLGGAPDVRGRAAEFGHRGGLDAAALRAELRRATADADEVLARLDPASLLEPRAIQGLRVSGLEALVHVVEHFSMHTGQILYLAKLRSGADLGLYEVDEAGRVVDTHW